MTLNILKQDFYMHKPLGFIIFLFMTILFIGLVSPVLGSGGKNDQGEEYYYNMGLERFREGYYELIPQGKVEEGQKKLEQAASALEVAVSMNPQRRESHWHLARIFGALQKFDKAAVQYQALIALDPDEIDNYLFLSSIYVQMRQFSDAMNVLEDARARTGDPQTIERIEDLVKTIRQREMTPETE